MLMEMRHTKPRGMGIRSRCDDIGVFSDQRISRPCKLARINTLGLKEGSDD
jgi:hypothetical protein